MPNKNSRIDRESKTVEMMISFYCRRHHQTVELCPECIELIAYSLEKLDKCPFQEGKTTCAKCPAHCYEPRMREKIRTVMKYSGPRMTFRHPVLALFHLIDGRRKRPVERALAE